MNCRGFKIEKALYEDLPQILALQYLTYRIYATLDFVIQPLKQTLAELQEEYALGMVLKAVNEDGQIIGSIRSRLQGDHTYLGKLMVHPDYENRGLGKALVKTAENMTGNKVYELFTDAYNPKLIGLYQKLGYRIIKEEVVNQYLTIAVLRKEIK
ncbi:MAG: GNAT family N-acetyltransferase [Chloroflexi bacterium]|nr:GNAT family N-acetyltransferase [Chloroflexota bacterium]